MAKFPEGYSVETVYGRLNKELAQEIVKFWMQQRVLPNIETARKRVRQVIDVIRNDAGEIVGLNSVYVAPYRNKADNYLFYRLYIRPKDRRPGLARNATEHLVETVRAHPELRPGIKGLVAVTENPKLTREAARRQLQRIGFEYDGRGPKGLDVWRIDFSDTESPQIVSEGVGVTH